MARGLEAFSGRRRIAGSGLAGEHAAGWPAGDRSALWWLVLVPLNSIVIVGLLVLALSWMIGEPTAAPASPAPPPSSAAGDASIALPVVNELEIGEETGRFGPVYTR